MFEILLNAVCVEVFAQWDIMSEILDMARYRHDAMQIYVATFKFQFAGNSIKIRWTVHIVIWSFDFNSE